jgi:hypothetical protein
LSQSQDFERLELGLEHEPEHERRDGVRLAGSGARLHDRLAGELDAEGVEAR